MFNNYDPPYTRDGLMAGLDEAETKLKRLQMSKRSQSTAWLFERFIQCEEWLDE